MASVTINPATGGDGEIASWSYSGGGVSGNWANAQAGENLNAIPAWANARVMLDAGPAYVYDNYLCRVLLPFSLAVVPAGSTITAATLRAYIASKTTTGGDDTIRVTKTTQASLTAITAATDWALISDTAYDSASYPTLNTVSTGAYLEIALNATAISDANANGFLKLCLRFGADVAETGYPPSPDYGAGYISTRLLNINTADAASNKPELVITYELPNQNISVGAAQEANSAQSVALDVGPAPQAITTSPASETDTAPAVGIGVTSDQDIPVSPATEADTAVPVAAVFPQDLAVGAASETDTAQPVQVSLALAPEGGLAFLFPAVSLAQALGIGPAEEADGAQALGLAFDQEIPIGPAGETDEAIPITAQVFEPQGIPVGVAAETDTARPAAVAQDIPSPPYTARGGTRRHASAAGSSRGHARLTGGTTP